MLWFTLGPCPSSQTPWRPWTLTPQEAEPTRTGSEVRLSVWALETPRRSAGKWHHLYNKGTRKGLLVQSLSWSSNAELRVWEWAPRRPGVDGIWLRHGLALVCFCFLKSKAMMAELFQGHHKRFLPCCIFFPLETQQVEGERRPWPASN